MCAIPPPIKSFAVPAEPGSRPRPLLRVVLLIVDGRRLRKTGTGPVFKWGLSRFYQRPLTGSVMPRFRGHCPRIRNVWFRP